MTARDFAKRVDWPRLVDRLGIATVLCGAVLWGTANGIVWIGETLIKPLVVDQIETAHVMREQIPLQTAFMKSLAESISRQESLHREDHVAIEAIIKRLDKPQSKAGG